MQEAIEDLAILGEIGAEDLHRDLLVDHLVAGEIDEAHPPFAEELLDLVAVIEGRPDVRVLRALGAGLGRLDTPWVAVLFGRMLDAHFQELDMHELQGKVTLIRNTLQDEAASGGRAERIQALERSFVGHESVGVLLRDVDGRVLNVIHPEHFTAAQRAGEPPSGVVTDWTVDGRAHRGIEVGIALPRSGSKDQTIAALVALDLSHHVHFLASVRNATWAGVVAAAMAASRASTLAA